MTLRIAAALVLVLGGGMLLVFLRLLGEGPRIPPEARHLRAMKDRAAAPASVTPMSFADMIALPHSRPLAEYAELERRGVSLEGYVQRMLHVADGDIHLEIVGRPLTPEDRDTSYLSAEVTPRVRAAGWPARAAGPGWSYEELEARLRPVAGGTTTWNGPPRRMRITGWLLYDWQYDTPWASLASHRVERLTGWEIHPVTRIEVWDDARAAFRELPR